MPRIHKSFLISLALCAAFFVWYRSAELNSKEFTTSKSFLVYTQDILETSAITPKGWDIERFNHLVIVPAYGIWKGGESKGKDSSEW